ncbi:MAG: glycosyltransferase family 4 protein [Candidatus Helarchaeota archaeon]
MRILHMIPGFFPIAKGGAEVFALNLCRYLVKKGNQVYLITRNLNVSQKEWIDGVQINRFKNHLPYKVKYYGFGRFVKSRYVRMVVALFDLFSAIPIVLRLVRTRRVQLIHASFILPFGLVGVLLKKLVKIGVIITVHGPADFYEAPKIITPLLRAVLCRADRIVAVAPRLQRDLIERLGDLPVDVVCNGVAIDSFNTPLDPEILGELGIQQEDFVILTAGRLVKRKNVDLLVRAAPKVLKVIAPCKIVILGSGIEKGNLKRLASQLHVQSKIILPGWVSDKVKVQLFKRADVFIQLSRREGLSLALLESKAAGIPAIIQGARDKQSPVTHEETGLVITAPIAVEDIVKALEEIWQNPEKRHEMGAQAKQEARRLFSLDRMVKDYLRIYQTTIKRVR